MPGGDSRYPPIADYAIIGNCRTAALVGRDGSLDWLCLPRFDGPALFAALLDRHRGGRFVVRPAAPSTATRRYIDDTAVLETTFTTARGRVRITDLMPVAAEHDRRAELTPEHEVLRLIEGDAGEVEVEVLCDPRPGYGGAVPNPISRGGLGWAFPHPGEAILLRSDIPLLRQPNAPGVRGRWTLRPGERHAVSLVYAHGEPAVLPVLGDEAARRLRRTVRWWRDWASRCRYQGPYRGDVVRSAVTLKLLTYAPSGAVVAAPTTSLPETLGGVRNWDYRYCWLRDASLTFRSLMDLGYVEEAEAFLGWMLHSTRLTWPELQVLYDLHGEARIPERELLYLEGYARSRPVRVGNAAEHQLQLDVYGEVVDAVFEFVGRGGRLDRATARMLVGLGRTVCRRWREPDEGIWEVRSERRHHTYSKAMCWVALDRLIRLADAGHLRAPVADFARERDAVRTEIETRGYHPRLGAYVSVLDGDELDASLLLLARYGYAEPTSARMRGTCIRVQELLGANGLLYRYRSEDGLPPGEGAFGIASFWAVACRCLQGDVAGAARVFEHVCARANDVGLFAEEIDPATGEHLGNFPQAFTHVGLIDAALLLAEARGQHVRQPIPEGERDAGVAG